MYKPFFLEDPHQISDMMSTRDNNKSDTTFKNIINGILSQDNVALSAKSAGVVREVNTETNIPLHVSDQYATIGDETPLAYSPKPFLNEEEARFVI